jgi:hypothetical protein
MYLYSGDWAHCASSHSLLKFQHVLGEDYPATLSNMSNLAVTNRHQGQCNETEALDVVVHIEQCNNYYSNHML